MFGFRMTLWILVAVLAAGLSACLEDDPVSTEPALEEIVQDRRDDVPAAGAISPGPEILPAQSVPTPGEPSGLDQGGDTPLPNGQAGAPSWMDDSEADSGLPIAGDSPEPGPSPYGTGGIDILFRNEATGENAVWHMDGTNQIGFSRVPGAPTAWDLAGVADFDGDNRADFVWRNTATGQNALWLMQGMSLGSFLWIPGVSSLDWRIVGAADFTGDGLPDLLWRNTSSGDIGIWEMNGTLFSAYRGVGRTNLDWEIVGTGDFSGDGNEDIVFRNQVTGGNALWLLSGTEFSGYQGLPRVSDLTWRIGGVGDLTGDGSPDLLWQRSSGTVALWEMSGVTFAAYHGISTLSNPDWHVAGLADFDAPPPDGNDTRETATELTPGSAPQQHSIQTSTDVDWFKWYVPEGASFTVTVENTAASGVVRLLLRNTQNQPMEDPDGTDFWMVGSGEQCQPDNPHEHTFSNLPAGWYYARMSGHRDCNDLFGIITPAEVDSYQIGVQAADLRIDAVHLNQANQYKDGGVSGIAARTGLLRVVALANGPNTAAPGVRVRLYQAATPLLDQVLPAPRTGVLMDAELDLGDATHTWSLELPPGLVVPGLSVVAEFDESGGPVDGFYDNNRFPASGSASLDVESLAPLRVVFIPIENSAVGEIGRVDETNMSDYLDAARTHLAVAEAQPSLHSVFTTAYDLEESDGWISLVIDIQGVRTAEGATDEYYHGIVPREGITPADGGRGFVPPEPSSPLRSAISLDANFTFPAKGTVAHELGHNLGLQHAPGCGAGGPDPGFPTASGLLDEVGYDSNTQTLVQPSVTYDLMSYCRPQWISAYYFNKMVDWRRSDPLVPDPLPVDNGSENVMVWGRVSESGVHVNPALPVDAPEQLPAYPGPYTVRLLGSGGVVLQSVSFSPVEVADAPGEAGFAFVVPGGPTGVSAIREVVLFGPRGTARALQGATIGGPPPGAGPDVAATVVPGATRRTQLIWDDESHPVLMIRNSETGEILSFARGGRAMVNLGSATVDDIEAVAPNGRRVRLGNGGNR